MQEDKQFLNKLSHAFRFTAIILLLSNHYFYFYGFFKANGWAPAFADTVLLRLDSSSILFQSPLVTLGLCYVFLGLSAMGTRGRRNLEKSAIKTLLYIIVGSVFLFGFTILISASFSLFFRFWMYLAITASGVLLLIKGGNHLSRLLSTNLMNDVFNEENESFQQEDRLINNEYSFNLPTKYQYKGTVRSGWINCVNPFRGSMVLGTPGSGKTFAIIIEAIKQHIQKGFAMYVYDFKFDDLSKVVYNTLLQNMDKYGDKKPKFYVINFDDIRRSHRCNPLLPELMTDIVDAYESAYTIRLNLNRSWIQKEAKRLWDRYLNIDCLRRVVLSLPYLTSCHVLGCTQIQINRHISTMKEIQNEVEAWQTAMNNKNSKINWQFTNKETRVKLKRLYPSLQD